MAETLSGALVADLATKTDVRESGASMRAELRESGVALRAELRETEVRLRAELRETELRLEAKMAEMKADLLKWLFGLVGFQTLVIVGRLAALTRSLH